MASMGVYDQIKKAFQDVVAPEINTLRGDIRLLDQKIDAVDQRLGQKIDAVDQRLGQRIDSLRTEMVSMKGELIAEIRRVDVRIDGVERTLGIAIDVRERLAAVEARLATS